LTQRGRRPGTSLCIRSFESRNMRSMFQESASSILLVSCYELGHQPAGIATAAGFLKRSGRAVEVMDVSVDGFAPEKAASARFVGISVPMHTALRLGVRVAEAIRRLNPRCHICFYGLYAQLNADHLLSTVADSIISGEFETALVELVEAIETRAETECSRSVTDARECEAKGREISIAGVTTKGSR